MSKLVNGLYDVARKAGKTASVLNDVENLAKGKPEKVVKKHVKKNLHKGLNKLID